MNKIALSRTLFVFLGIIATSSLSPAILAQNIEQLTNFIVSVGSPPALDDAGTAVYSGVPTNQFGGNPDNKAQIFAFDPALTGVGTQKSSFSHGVAGATADFLLSSLLAVSDDNIWLAFVSSSDPLGTNRDQSPELFAMKTDGTMLTQLTNDPSPNAGSVTRMAFAGSGNRVAFVSNSNYLGSNPNHHITLFVVNADGTGLAQLVPAQPSVFAGLSISDDGTKIAFSSTADLGDFDGDGTTDNQDRGKEIFTILWDGTGLDQLTDDPAFNSIAPDISGDGSTIAFQSNANLDGFNNKNQEEIYVIDWGGANLDHLTDSNNNTGATPFAAAPSITDDGQVIFGYTNHNQSGFNTDGNQEIFKINKDGSGLTQVTSTIFSEGCFFPRVSGDGSRVAFYAIHDFDGTNNQDLSIELFASASDGTNLHQLTIGTMGSNRDLDMAPDAGTLVFSSNLNPLGTDPERNGELYKINGDGTGLTQITSFITGNVSVPSISGDGSKIAFLAEADIDGSNSDGTMELHVVNSDSTGLVRLTSTPRNLAPRSPFLTHDGSLIFFSSPENLGSNPDDNRELWKILADGTGRVQLTEDTAAGRRVEFPRADGSGTWVVFQSNGDLDGDGTTGWNEIWRIRSDGTSLTKVFGAPGFNALFPDISFDGSSIAFESTADPFGTNPENNPEVFLHDVATTTTTQLTVTASGSSGQPRFSDNGSWIYFSTNAPFFETDPDNPYHNARINLSTLAVERVGGLQAGIPDQAIPNADGSVVAFFNSGNPILQNWDIQPEILIMRPDEPVEEISVSGAAPTTISWQWTSGAMRYDVARGNVANLAPGVGGTVNLGPVVCVEDNSLDIDTADSADPVDPPPGGAFFYLWRGSQGLNAGPGSYGTSTGGGERQASAGDCSG